MQTKATKLSFFIVFTSYLLYGWVLVPIVLPNFNEERNASEISNAYDPIREEITHFLELFPENSWERNPKNTIQWLQFGQFVILFGKDTPEGNSLRLEPCTILLLPDGFREYLGTDECKELIQQSVIFRTQNAEIVFDSDFGFRNLTQPNFVAGHLWGEVTVQSNMKNGGHDDFYLEAQDVHIIAEADSITITPHGNVRFNFGLHSGRGADLSLRLAQTDSGKELDRITIQRLEALRFVFPEEHSNAVTMIDVHCQRHVEIVANPTERGWRASFYQDVDMRRTNPGGAVDRLTAHEVHLTLAAAQQTATGREMAISRRCLPGFRSNKAVMQHSSAMRYS